MAKSTQETLDYIVQHAHDNPVCSYDNTMEQCAYRGTEGAKCFVGALIDDKHYYPHMEGKNGDEKEVQRAVQDSGWLIEGYLSLVIQAVHDNVEVGDWQGHLKREIEEEGYIYNPPK